VKLATNASFYLFRVEEYIKTGKDKYVVDPDPDKIYSKRKEFQTKRLSSNNGGVEQQSKDRRNVKFPESNWSSSLTKMPMFTRAEMNNHINRTGKNVAGKSNNSIPTNLKKAQTFLQDEYLHCIETNSDQRHFYVRAKCCHSFKKNDPPHNVNVALCIASGEVAEGNCSCVAGKVGYCNHVLALMLKLCKYCIFECTSTKDLGHESDQNPSSSCTSELQKWHKKGGGKNIVPEPVMNVEVNKTKVDESGSKEDKRGGIKSLLFEARVNVNVNRERESCLKENLRKLVPDMGFSQMAIDNNRETTVIDSKYGKCPSGSPMAYQLAFNESHFKTYVDVSSTQRVNQSSNNVVVYPRFPLTVVDRVMNIPLNLTNSQQLLMNSLSVDENQIAQIEQNTQKQSQSDEWKDCRKYRFTASRFQKVKQRQKQHDTFATSQMYPPDLNNKYVQHGRRFESVALLEYEKAMKARNMPVVVLASGLVISQSHPILGATPDAKIIDVGCEDCFGLAEVKCPWTKANVDPLDACSDTSFCMEKTGEKTCLKQTSEYYAQVQGQMGITGAKWCDFIVYTRRGIYIQRVPFNKEYWKSLREKLASYYFKHFIQYAAEDFISKNTPTQDVNDD